MRCPICNQVIGALTPAHIKKHGYTNSKELFKDYPQLKQKVERMNLVYDERAKHNLSKELGGSKI